MFFLFKLSQFPMVIGNWEQKKEKRAFREGFSREGFYPLEIGHRYGTSYKKRILIQKFFAKDSVDTRITDEVP
jgi:hypothetical protein